MEFIGYIAAIFTTFAFLPQLIKAWRIGSVKELSLCMFVMMYVGAILWLFYGIFKQCFPMIISNGIALVIYSGLLFMKIKFRQDLNRR